MDLLLWRHADAEDASFDEEPTGQDGAAAARDDGMAGRDAARRLTSRGLKQALRMAAWLDGRIPQSARLIVSPAVRAQQTAAALSRQRETSELVNNGARAADVLRAAGWPSGSGTVIVVGHQPTLGAAAALALTGKAAAWRFRKGAVWWLRSEEGDDAALVAVLSPDLV